MFPHEYTFVRIGQIAYHDGSGKLSFAPPVLSQKKFAALLARMKHEASCRIDEEVVLTAGQYGQLKSVCPADFDFVPSKSYVWLNSPKYGRFYDFNAQCRKHGKIGGTSIIPPIKVKELLPPKQKHSH